MKEKDYTHYRIVNILQVLVGLIIELILIRLLPLSTKWMLALAIVAILSNLFILLLFYKSVISIGDERITFKFGVGAIAIPIEIAEIERCLPLELPRVDSKGIFKRYMDWQNRVTRTKAVEIQYVGKDTVTQFETSYPIEVAAEVNKLVAAQGTIV